MSVPHIIISSKKKWSLLDSKELIRHKDLFYFLVLRDISVLYKQTVLGFSWAVMNPVIHMLLFTVVFGKIANVSSDNIPYPLFSYAALLPWTYFSQSLIAASNSLVLASSIFTKVYFPRILIPLTPIFSKLVDFFIAFSILIILMFYYGITPGLSLFFLPLLILLMILTSAGIGMLLSSMAVQYRDIKFAVPILSQFLMYAAPVVFPASLILKKFGRLPYLLYGLYPMAGVIEGFRASIIGVHPMPWNLIGIGCISSALIFLAGTVYFRKAERYFADMV